MNTRRIILLLVAFVALLGAANTYADTKTWVSGATWNTATWSPVGNPVAGDDVILPTGCSITSLGAAQPTSGSLNSLTLNGTAALTLNNYAFSVSGATILNDTSAIKVTSGTTKSFGDFTINSGCAWTNTGNNNVTWTGNFTVNSGANFISTGASGIQIFSGTGQINGTATSVSISRITITGTYTLGGSVATLITANALTVSNSFTLPVGTIMTNGSLTMGAGTLINNGTMTVLGSPTMNLAGGTINNNGTFIFNGAMGSATNTSIVQGPNASLAFASGSVPALPLTATASGNTVTYSAASATQVVRPGSYHNLTLSSNGARTMPGVTSIAGTLSYLQTGSGTVTLDAGTTVGNLIVNGSGGTLATANAASALAVTGTTTVYAGTLKLGGSAATATFTGNFTISGGTFNGNGGTPSFGGNFTADGGTLTASAGAYTFTGSGKTIGGTVNPIPIKVATITGSCTLGQNVSCVSGGTWTVSGGSLSFGAYQLTGAGTLTVNSAGTVVGNGTNQLTSGLTALNFDGTLNINQGLPTFSGGESFKVFGAGACNITSMAVIPSTPPGAISWDYTTTPGTLIVIGSGSGGGITITSITRSGTDVTLMGTGGTPSGPFNVLTSSNVSAPRGTWPVYASGNFDGSGNFNITFAAPGTSPSFFVIQQ